MNFYGLWEQSRQRNFVKENVVTENPKKWEGACLSGEGFISESFYPPPPPLAQRAFLLR